MTTEEKLYLAGYLDAGRGSIEMTGRISGKKRKCSSVIQAGSQPDFVKFLQQKMDGIVRRHYKTSYSIKLRKELTINLFQEVGPYMVRYRNKIKELENYTRTISDHPKALKMQPIDFIEHENELSYVVGFLDNCASMGVYYKKAGEQIYDKGKSNERTSNIKASYYPRVQITDESGYVSKYFKKNKIKLNEFTAQNKLQKSGDGYKILQATCATVKDFAKWYVKHTKKEQNKCLLSTMLEVVKNKGEENACRQDYLDSLNCKKFILDESILSGNSDGEKLHKEKLKRKADELKKNNLETRFKLIKQSGEARKKLINKKKTGVKAELNKITKQYLSIFKKYKKIKERWEEINSDFKTCGGTDKKLHKDEFNIDRNTWDGLCRYSLSYINEARVNKYQAAIKQSNDKRRENPLQRISDSMSTQVSMFLKGGKGGQSWKDIVGYTPEELVKHLTNHPSWKKQMKLENYGEWAVDHIKPKREFDWTNEIDIRRCWSLQNLQPMWFSENSIKSGGYDREQMKEHEKILQKIR